jgi:hypothetical protein
VVQCHPARTHVYSKTDEDTELCVPGESTQYHEMTSLDKIPAATHTNANSTQTDDVNGEVTTWDTEMLTMTRVFAER